MTVVAKKLLIIAVAVAAMSACVSKQTAPDLTGPSGLGLSLDLKASPDVLFRDGVSTSTISITVTDGANNPVSGLTVALTSSPNLGTLSAGMITTNASGRATATYTVPGPGGTTTATVTATPTGSNYQNTTIRSITIRLFQPAS